MHLLASFDQSICKVVVCNFIQGLNWGGVSWRDGWLNGV